MGKKSEVHVLYLHLANAFVSVEFLAFQNDTKLHKDIQWPQHIQLGKLKYLLCPEGYIRRPCMCVQIHTYRVRLDVELVWVAEGECLPGSGIRSVLSANICKSVVSEFRRLISATCPTWPPPQHTEGPEWVGRYSIIKYSSAQFTVECTNFISWGHHPFPPSLPHVLGIGGFHQQEDCS